MQLQQEERRLFLHGEVGEENTLSIIKEIKRINEQDDLYSQSIVGTVIELQKLGVIDVDYVQEPRREPIILEINSGGGLVSSGFSLISAIENSATPIIGYVTGECCSMAITILASCHYRLSTRYARFMIHEISGGYIGKIGEMKRHLSDQMTILEAQYTDVLVEYTDMKKEEVSELFDKGFDFWFDPNQAKKYGIVDSIDTEGIEQSEIMDYIYSNISEDDDTAEDGESPTIDVSNISQEKEIKTTLPLLEKREEEPEKDELTILKEKMAEMERMLERFMTPVSRDGDSGVSNES